MRSILRWLLVFPALILIYLTFSLIGGIIPQLGESAPQSEKMISVLLIQGPIHYDVLLPLNDVTLQTFGDYGLPLAHLNARWLVVGWGAREFYTATGSYQDITAHAVWRGIVGDRSVMRLDLAPKLGKHVRTKTIVMTDVQYSTLLDGITASFARTPAGQPIAINTPGFSTTDMFFEAQGTFNLFQTCNVWIGQQLRAAGLRFGMWTPTPYAISVSHWLYQSD